MIQRTIFLLIFSIFIPHHMNGQKSKTDAHIVGHVICGKKHIPFAHVSIKGTTIGTTTDATGHYRITNIPTGTHILQASHIGYQAIEKQITIQEGETKELHFKLTKNPLSIEQVVVTGSRKITKREEAPVIVNSISPQLLKSSQSVTLKEGLQFTTGIRTENNCQNCGFTQVRMNGMKGRYSQILINSRPIFSDLSGVYGLELIPSNMIERIEVTHGGGSALYGSNAIAGTINLILKKPDMNSYEASINRRQTGIGYQNPAPGYHLNFNTSCAKQIP